MENKTYVTQRNGAYYVGDTRVSLDSVVYDFLDGETPEAIVQDFPALTLEQVYGSITFYLAHRAEIDAYLQEGSAQYERDREAERQASPAFYQKFANARQPQS